MTLRQNNLANDLSSWGPYINAISTSTVHISIHVTLDAIRDAILDESEEPLVHDESSTVTFFDVKGKASIQFISACCGLTRMTEQWIKDENERIMLDLH